MDKNNYQPPQLWLLGMPVPQVFCTSGDIEALGESNYSGVDSWEEVL